MNQNKPADRLEHGQLLGRRPAAPVPTAHCGLRFERTPGYQVGAIGVNMVVTFDLILIALLVGVSKTSPDVPFSPIPGATVAVAIVVPIAIRSTARPSWAALDLVLDPLRDDKASGLGVSGIESAKSPTQPS